MGRLFVNQTLERQIRQYCELNGIEDINAFANRCLSQGFSIVKFGTSPIDNVNRENKGIKDISKDEYKKQTKPSRKEESKPTIEETIERDPQKEEGNKKEEEVKTPVVVRKIRVIKKG